VVAKPVGTLTPDGKLEIISPRLAFFPPTDSTSVILKFSNGTTKAVELNRLDMGDLQKLKTDQYIEPSVLVRQQCPCEKPDFVVVLVGQCFAWMN
jgi:hypothetical protein